MTRCKKTGITSKPNLKVALLAGVAAAFMVVQPAAADTLLDAMSMAYQGNPNLLAARAQLRATDENVPIALSGWRPTLTVNGNVQNNRTENQIFSGGGVGQVVTGGTTKRFAQSAVAQFTQPVFRGFKTWAGTSAAKNQVYAQRARLQATEAQVLLQVATAYFDVVQFQAVVELNLNNVQVLNRQLEATQDRFRVGEITRTDVAQAEASLAGAKASLVQAEGALQQARAAYENVVGKPPENLVSPALPTNLPTSYDAVLAAATDKNPAYIAADFAAKAADDNITVVTGDLLPSVNLVGQYTRAWNTVADKSRTEQVIAQAQLSVPLYQQGAEYARVRQAKHSAGQQRLLADQARLDARNAATQAWENLSATTASIDSFQSQIKANEIALEGVQREAEVGSRTVLDVLNAEQTLLNSRVSLVRAQHDQSLAAHQLLSAIGVLSGEGMGLSGAIYDPLEHYDDVEYQAFGTGADVIEAPAKAPASEPASK
jgi:outer membrane protein